MCTFRCEPVVIQECILKSFLEGKVGLLLKLLSLPLDYWFKIGAHIRSEYVLYHQRMNVVAESIHSSTPTIYVPGYPVHFYM